MPPATATFRPRQRLRHDLQYQRVYGSKMRKSSGPIGAFSAPNGLSFYRLGLSVGKSVGNAVARHRVKRMLREAFRLSQHGLPLGADGGYDLILSARPHAIMTLDEYIRAVGALAAALHHAWERRSA